MLIINGIEMVEGAFILDPNIEHKVTVYTDDHTVLKSQTGETLVMNTTSNKAFTLFTPTVADVGKLFTFANINTGRLTINVAGAGVKLVDGTAATGTLYCDDDSFAQITIQLMSATQWSVIGAHGTWTTT